MKMISNCRLPRMAIVLLTVAWAVVTSAAAPIWNWPAPASEAVFENYKLTVGGVEVPVYACRVSAVRLDTSGQVIAMAAAGLKTFVGSELRIELPERADVVLWRNHQNQWQGVLQGHSGPLPDGLNRITTNWARLRLPVPLGKEPQE